jgi:type I protein arginine methyltransferase
VSTLSLTCLDIHETMLKDTVRTDAYRDFVYENKHLFQGKVVLDVGCGTGILSMFCARAGASKVIAVDNSNIIDKARVIIGDNCLENVITCVKGKMEDITLPVDKVDIIISEWMGYGLLYEAMLKSVIWARDKYLKPSGLMVPSYTVLRIAPITDPDFIVDNIHFWDDVYGFDMTPMRENIYDEVLIKEVEATAVAGDSFPFLVLDLHSTRAEDLTFSRSFSVTLSQTTENLDGFALWFDTFFLMPGARLTEDARGETFRKETGKGCAFTTGPHGRDTHWKCAVLLVDQSKHRTVAVDRGTKISGSISYAERGSNKRGLDVEVTWEVEKANRYGQQMWVLQ